MEENVYIPNVNYKRGEKFLYSKSKFYKRGEICFNSSVNVCQTHSKRSYNNEIKLVQKYANRQQT